MMITIEEIPVERMEEFWKIHMEYLLRDEIIAEEDEEDKAYFQGDEYRGMIKAHMLREVDRHHLVYFVENEKRIGAAQYNTYQSEDGKCFILDFWVFPEFRGNGTGHACFKALEAYTKKDGALYYEINCEKENSRRFWLDNGFVDNGVDEYDMPLMIKKEDYSHIRIETKDLLLKKAEFDDWEDLYKNLWCHEESARYMLWKVTTNEEDAKIRIKKTIDFEKKEKYAFIVYLKETNEAIGFAGMQEQEPGIYEETGIAIGPSFVGKGYGKQILNALIDEARALGAKEFEASNRVKNIASHNLQQSCGFEFDHYSEEKEDPRTGEKYVLAINKKKL